MGKKNKNKNKASYTNAAPVADGKKTTVVTSNVKSEENKVEEPKVVELHFSVPVQGEIAKDFSDSNLTYSETLQEWTVHLGIDIKADKGSSVVASEAGTVESIKNDPRYGLTVTIAHANGFKSIYFFKISSNFLLAAFNSASSKRGSSIFLTLHSKISLSFTLLEYSSMATLLNPFTFIFK